MEWYILLPIAIAGLVLFFIGPGLLMMAYGMASVGIAFVMQYILCLSLIPMAVVYNIYMPSDLGEPKGDKKKWFRHGACLNILKVVFLPIALFCIPIAQVQFWIIKRMGIGR